jgi:outer membrane protein TolC
VLSVGFRRGGLLALVFALAGTPTAYGQDVATLTLEEAIALARRNNPDYLAQANDITVADWAVRDAYGALLPGASVSTTYG